MDRRRRPRLGLALAGPFALVVALVAVTGPGPPPRGTHPSSHAMHHVEVSPAAYVAAASPLSRAGRTVRTSAASGGTAITLDLHARRVVSGLTYRPPSVGTLDGAGGRVGRFSVSLSDDGTDWGRPVATGTWADDGAVKTAELAQQATRFVRLTALGGAGAAGPVLAPEQVDLLGASTSAPSAQYVAADRTGWTASASDEETARGRHGADLVLDGSPTTYWQSRTTGTVAPLPHSITIDMQRSMPVAGLRYQPLPKGGDGTIGDYRIAVSTDATSYADVASGSWVDGRSAKLATFAPTTARYVRLTATSEAGDRGPLSSAAEIDVLQATTSAPGLGSWGPVLNFPIVPVSAALLPGDRLLTFSAFTPVGFSTNPSTTAPSTRSFTQTALLDLATDAVGQRIVTDTEHQMFCSGLALLPDGRLLVNGGSDSGATSIYSPSSDTWSKGPAMNIPRGYEGDTTLSTGGVFTLGGSWSGGEGGKDGEVFDPDGSWRRLPNVSATSILTRDPGGIYRSDNHGWFFAVADGGVFHAGPSRQMSWFTTQGAGSQTSAGLRGSSDDAMNGNAVMYDVDKILTLGGAPAYRDVDATRAAYTIDLSGGPGRPVTTTQTGSMDQARAFSNSVVLPDGTVLVVGGQPHPDPFSDTDASLVPELWDPATGRFTSLAPMAVPRTYHSVALLLPDGRVFSGGGGLCGSCATNHSDGQIFTPPYLLNADGSLRERPTLSRAPAVARHGTKVAVTASPGLTRFALLRMGATTHTVDSDQRRVPVVATPGRVTARGAAYRLAIPASTGVVVPGTYLLFAIDRAGTPSLAKEIRIS